MKPERVQIGGIPALLYGAPAERGYLFLHGQMGRKEEAEAFAQGVCPKGYQVLSIDLPAHGERQGRGEELVPWTAAPDIRAAWEWAERRWNTVSLRANSIVAYFSMLVVDRLDRALLVSPILGGTDLDHDGLGRGDGGGAAGAGRDRCLLRSDPILGVHVLGAGAPGPQLELSRPHPLWKRR